MMNRLAFLRGTLLAPLVALLPWKGEVEAKNWVRPVRVNPLTHTGPRDWWPEFQLAISQTSERVRVELRGDEDCDEYTVSDGGFSERMVGHLAVCSIPLATYGIMGRRMEVTATHRKSGATTTARFMVDDDTGYGP